MSRRIPTSLLISTLFISLLSASLASEEIALDALIEKTTRSSQSAPLEQTGPLLDKLLARLDEADPAQRAQIRYLQIRWLGLGGQYEQSLILADQALAESPPPDQAVALYRLAANIAIYAGQQEQAFRYLNRAFDTLATHDNAREHAAILLLSSQLQSEAGNTARAVEHALTGVQLSQQVDDLRIQCGMPVWAAAALTADGQAERALEVGLPALPTCRQVNDPSLIGSLLNKLADAYLSLGLTEPVGPMLDEAEALMTGHYEEGARFSRLLAARWLLAEGRPRAALEQARALVSEFERLGLWRRLDATLEVQARALAELGEQEGHYRARQQQLIARERFLDHSRLLSLANAEVSLEARRNQRELALLNEQARVSALREQTDQAELRLRLMLTGLVGTVLVLLSTLLWLAGRERRHYVRLAEHDGLTGIANHSCFFARLERQIEAFRAGTPGLSLVLADIDHFKRINDRLGHPAGDAILRQTAAALDSVFADHGFSGRIGGEEFAVCLPGLSAIQARQLAEKLRAELFRHGVGDGSCRLSLSFGIAELKHGESPAELRARADQALYAAKRRGRDQIMLA
jgi:diguanylate cyclase (GGDEF)-like protein